MLKTIRHSFALKFLVIISLILLFGLGLTGITIRRMLTSDTFRQTETVSSVDSASSGLNKAQNKTVNEQTKAQVLERFGKMPLHFEPNDGQIGNHEARFASRGDGYSLHLTSSGAILSLNRTVPTSKNEKHAQIAGELKQISKQKGNAQKYEQAIVEMRIVGANRQAQSAGSEVLESKSNYFIGNDPAKWRTGVANYGRVRFEEVYQGIDLEYYGNQRQLEYDFIVKPDADPERIKLNFKGVSEVKVDETGELVLKTSVGEVRQKKPFVYQEDETTGERREIASGYKVKNKEVSFSLAEYDRNKELVIDPVVLVYSTYHGGNNDDSGYGVAVDSAGNAYITGSAGPNFPVLNAGQNTSAGWVDSFISKFSPSGVLLYSTYHGGNDRDLSYGIAADSEGNAYVAGETFSTNFPVLNARQYAHAGGQMDSFVSKFSPTGILLFSTYHGGDSRDACLGIAVDSAGNVYVTGETLSVDFPLLNAAQETHGSIHSSDAFISKFSPTGSLLYSTYHGGNELDSGYGVAVDSAGNAYVTGSTKSENFSILNAGQSALSGEQDAFVSKFSPTGTLLYSTYFGGGGNDSGYGIALDSAGNIYVAGTTESTNLPIQEARQIAHGGEQDAFVSKFNPSGSLLYSTYHGGNGSDSSSGIAVDSAGNIYITGETFSNDFPLLNAGQNINSGGASAFISKLSYLEPSLHSIGGRIMRGSQGLSGVSVSLSGERSFTTTTDASGSYIFTNLPAGGSYTITPSSPAYKLSPQSLTFFNLTSDQTSADFIVGTNCSYALSPTIMGIPAEGTQNSSFSVSATSGCGWTANGDRNWIAVSGGGSGNGTVGFTVAANTGGARQGNIIVQGQILTINQEANPNANLSTPFDFDGDGKTDISIYRPAAGEWWYLRSADGGNRAFQFGSATDRIVPADFTGDGKTDIAFFRPSTGEWFILRSEDFSFYSFPFGTSEDIPVAEDFDGDRKADAAIFRPSTATWYIFRSSGGVTIQQFGSSIDIPVPSDFDGDGKADLAIFRQTAGEWWHIRSSDGENRTLQFGDTTDKPVPADYTGDGKTDFAFYRPSTSEWFVSRSENLSYYSAPFGSIGDIPVPGDYDGDGKADIAVWRPSDRFWYVAKTGGGFSATHYGAPGDTLIPSFMMRLSNGISP